jgi:hypothetical protein
VSKIIEGKALSIVELKLIIEDLIYVNEGLKKKEVSEFTEILDKIIARVKYAFYPTKLYSVKARLERIEALLTPTARAV